MKMFLVLFLATAAFAHPQFQRIHIPKTLSTSRIFPTEATNFDSYIPEASETDTPVVSSVKVVKKVVPASKNYFPNEYEVQQNKNAQYEFSSDVDDHISDLTQQRTETRNGLNVKGSYSYSDGYYKRTVHYEADENGYRVTGMEAIPLDGPQIDLGGTASVNNEAHGTHVSYRVQSVPVEGPVAKIVDNTSIQV